MLTKISLLLILDCC